MATRDKNILNDGYRNAVVKLSGTIDKMDENWVRAIELKDFTNNDVRVGNLVALKLDAVEFAVGDGLSLVVEWDGNTPQQMGVFTQSDEISYMEYGGLKPNWKLGNAGLTGGINVKTINYTAGTTKGWGLLLRMSKIYG